MDDDELLAELGVDAAGATDITELRHVRTSAEKRAAEEIANRKKCEDFESFKPLFEQVQKELETGIRDRRARFELKAEIRPGSLFIVGGQKAYVAEVGEVFTTEHGRTRRRLRVIYDNGTESNVLHALASARASQGRSRAAHHRSRSPGRCSPARTRRAIRQAARSMCCAASPTIRSSQRTATCCTRSA